ncbi:MAG: aspartyl protease family protein [bacterium]
MTTEALDSMWANRQLFDLRNAVAPDGVLGPDTTARQFYLGAVAAGFELDESANEILSRYLDHARSGRFGADTTHTADAEVLRAEVAARNGHYARAAEWLASALSSRRSTADSATVDDWSRDLAVWRGLRAVAEQRVVVTDTTPTHLARDRAGLLTLFARNASGDSGTRDSVQMIFDTGAGLTVVTTTTASRLGVRFTGDSVDVEAATGIQVRSALGEIPRLSLGSVTVEHVVVLVMRDADLSFPEANYAIHGIIGYPVLAAMGRMTVSRDLWLRSGVQAAPIPLAARNVAVDGLAPLVEVGFAHRLSAWTLDTGAQATIAYPRFLARHGEAVRAAGVLETEGLGSAGGGTKVSGYHMRDVQLMLGKGTITVPQMTVLRVGPTTSARRVFGNLGLDAFAGATRVTIDLRGGTVFVE